MMDCDYRVKVIQGQMVTYFGFVELCDAMDFARTCIECGDKGTQIIVSEVDERKEYSKNGMAV